MRRALIETFIGLLSYSGPCVDPKRWAFVKARPMSTKLSPRDVAPVIHADLSSSGGG